MKIIILGSGSPIPDGKRTCASALVTDATFGHMLFDCGSGTSFRLAQARIPFQDLDNIFLTHLHMDHCLELPNILFASYLGGRKKPINVYGPPGLINFAEMIFDEMFPYLKAIVKNVTGNEFSPVYHEISPNEKISKGDVSILSGSVAHGNIDAYGYRLEAKNKVLTISGDTEPCDGIVELANDSDILIHECVFPDSAGKVPGHTIPSELSIIAQKSKSKHVVLTHLFPACNGHEDGMIISIQKNYDGLVTIPNDLDKFDI